MWQKNINDFDRVVAIGGGHGMPCALFTRFWDRA